MTYAEGRLSTRSLLFQREKGAHAFFFQCVLLYDFQTANRVRHEVFATALWLFFGVSRRVAASQDKRRPQRGEGGASLPSRFVLSKVEQVPLMNGSSSSLHASAPVYRNRTSSCSAKTSSSFRLEESAVVPNGSDRGLRMGSRCKREGGRSFVSQGQRKETTLGREELERKFSRVVFWQGRRFTYSPESESFLLSKSELPMVSRVERTASEHVMHVDPLRLREGAACTVCSCLVGINSYMSAPQTNLRQYMRM